MNVSRESDWERRVGNRRSEQGRWKGRRREENVQQGSRNRVDLTGGETSARRTGKGTGIVTVPGTWTPKGRLLVFNHIFYTGIRGLCLVSLNLYSLLRK